MDFIKKVLGGQLRQSLGSLGQVVNRYGRDEEFAPEQQLKGITYKAIDKIGKTLSVYRPIVVKQNGDAYQNHPVYNLFRNPNPRWKSTDFIHLYGMLMEIYGETFWYLVKGENSKKVKEVYMLNPLQIEIKTDEGEIIGYVLHKHDGTRIPLEVDEIIHDKYPNPFNEWRGLSVLERAAVYVGTELTTANFTLNYMKNNASPSGIVSTPDMSQEGFQKFVSQWREGYEGPSNAGKTAFIRGGEAKFQAVGATLDEVDAKNIRNMSKDDVLMMFDLPKPLLGLTDKEGFGRGNLETLKLVYAESKLEPLMKRLDKVYDEIITIGRLGNPADYVTHESPVPEDRDFQHKQHKDLVNVALTVNEVREQIGLPPIEGGDELDPESRPTQAQEVRQESVKVVKKTEKASLNESDSGEEFRKRMMEVAEEYIPDAKKVISEFARQQEKMVVEKINASAKAYDEWLYTQEEEKERLAEELIPIMIALAEAQTAGVANFVTGELVTITDQQRKVISQQITQIAGVYNEDTLRALEKTLAQGTANGESLNKLKKRVEDVYTDAKGYRAERIARTESMRISNATAEYSYKQAGYEKVQWRANPDRCEYCAVMAGQTKEVGGLFLKNGDVVTGIEGGQMSVSYRDIEWPPLHPNCECGLDPA